LILVVEELLPNWVNGWQGVATLYQHHSGELIHQDEFMQSWHLDEEEELAGVGGSTSADVAGVGSRNNTPTVSVDVAGDGSLGIVAVE
jgi:hypothetical protein